MNTHKGSFYLLGIVVVLLSSGCPQSVIGTWDVQSVESDTGETTASVWTFYADSHVYIEYESGVNFSLTFKQNGEEINLQGHEFFSDLELMNHVPQAQAEFTCDMQSNLVMDGPEDMTGETSRTVHNEDNSINETVYMTETAHRRGLYPF